MVAPRTFVPYPVSCHPQPARPQPLQSSMLTVIPDVVPMRYTAAADVFTAPENCTYTESLLYESLVAFPRIHRRYGIPAVATNATSKYDGGEASGAVSFVAAASGFSSLIPPAAV